MVTAKFLRGRVVTHSFQFVGVEDIVDTQHLLAIAVGVHIAVAGSSETVLEEAAEVLVGIGGRQGVEVTADDYRVGAVLGEVADGVGLQGAFHKISMQGFRSIFGCPDFTACIVRGHFALPFATLLADTRGLQVTVEQTDGIRSCHYIAQYAAIGALRVGDEPFVYQRITAEHRDGKHFAEGVFLEGQYMGPMRSRRLRQ